MRAEPLDVHLPEDGRVTDGVGGAEAVHTTSSTPSLPSALTQRSADKQTAAVSTVLTLLKRRPVLAASAS